MKAILTIDLQEDNGTSVMKGTQTKPNFVQTDYEQVMGFLTGKDLRAFVEYLCWITGPDGVTPRVPKPPNGSSTIIGNLTVS